MKRSMKLARVEKAPIVKGSKISNPDGSRYVVVRVSGSTVTANRIPTALELTARYLGTVAGVVRAAYRNARITAATARARYRRARR